MRDWWESHDEAFHLASRKGFMGGVYGGAFPYPGAPEPPAMRPEWPGPGIALPAPHPLTASLGSVMASRRSRREPKGLSARDLATLLSCFRIREAVKGRYTSLRKAVPSGGGMHSIEAYVAMRGPGSPVEGFFHYGAGDGRLYPVNAPSACVDALLADASQSAGVEHRPAALIVLASRFPRMQWKYRRMAYAAILKDVGVCYGNLALIAAALDLNACPLGGGDAELFARATALDPMAEGSVGEMAIF